MHPQLEEVQADLNAALARIRRLAAEHPETAWTRNPAGGGWSAAECVVHLNLTSAAVIPGLEKGIDEAQAAGGPVPRRLRRDPVGWLIWRMSRPTARTRVATRPGFSPGGTPPLDGILAEFERLQQEKLGLLHAADGLPIHKVRIRSVFEPRIRYSLYSAFTILATHQHRHLAQAERALAEA